MYYCKYILYLCVLSRRRNAASERAETRIEEESEKLCFHSARLVRITRSSFATMFALGR